MKIIRYFPTVFIAEHPHTSTDIPRLTFSKSARTHQFLNLLRVSRCEGFHIRKFLIKLFYYYIYTGIRTLRRKPHTHEQLPCIIIIQSTPGIRILFFQPFDDLTGQPALFLQCCIIRMPFSCSVLLCHLYLL